MSDAATIAASLTKAQRRALATFDERVWSARELHFQTWGALFNKGLLADYRAAGHRFFSWTGLGLAVRAEILATLKDTDHG